MKRFFIQLMSRVRYYKEIGKYMGYIDKVYELYVLLTGDSLLSDINASEFIFDSFFKGSGKFSVVQELQDSYRNEIKNMIDFNLKEFSADIQLIRQLKKVSYYEHSIAFYTSFLILWIESRGLKLSVEELKNLMNSIYLGMIGYRLFDIHYDDETMGKESAILGNYLLHLGEELLIKTIKQEDSFGILNKYLRNYTRVEFIEKRNRWKSCPFSWDDLSMLGFKAAPIFSLFEVAGRKAGISDKDLIKLIEGLNSIAVVGQLMDDMKDAKEDLSNGIETLVMSGFYERFGTDCEATLETINSILTEDRILVVYNTIQNLFEKARSVFTDQEDDVLLLFLEIHALKFNSEFVNI